MPDLSGLPGAPLVVRGLRDLRDAHRTVPALLVSLAVTRLGDLGVDVRPPTDWPAERELALYDALLRDPEVEDAFFRYKSLRAELDSFILALEFRERAA